MIVSPSSDAGTPQVANESVSGDTTNAGLAPGAAPGDSTGGSAGDSTVGANGATGATEGADQGGSGDSAGAVGAQPGVQGGASDQNVVPADTAMISEPPPAMGAPCDSPGAYRCVAAGTASRQLCGADNLWGAQEDCPAQQVCVGEAGECITQDEICKGKQGQNACAGSVMHQCDATARSTGQMDCGHPQKCELGVALGTCAECIPGQDHKCEGAQLQVCNADGRGYGAKGAPCATAALCNATAQACTDATCSPGQVTCVGQALQKCNATQTGFDTLTTCGAGETCDPAGQQCDICTPNTSRCGSSGREVCAADGTSWRPQPCGGGTPQCAGGECVACTDASHCSGLAGTCEEASCAANKCTTRITQGASCTQANRVSGVCSPLGDCVECLGDGDCDQNESCSARNACEREPTCGDGILDRGIFGEICDDGNTNSGDGCSADCKVITPYRIACSSAADCKSSLVDDAAEFCFPSGVAGAPGFCTPRCAASLPCPEVPSAEGSRTAADVYGVQCSGDTVQYCFISCAASRSCPVGYVCKTDNPALGSICIPPGW